MNFPMGLGIGLLAGLVISADSVSPEFRDAADADKLTNELVCKELKARIDSVNENLLRVKIKFDSNKCLQSIAISQKPSSP